MGVFSDPDSQSIDVHDRRWSAATLLTRKSHDIHQDKWEEG
jgi:hypothetical protein